MIEKGMSKGAEFGVPAADANQPAASRAMLLNAAVCAPSMYTAGVEGAGSS